MKNYKRTFIPASHRPKVAGSLIDCSAEGGIKKDFYQTIQNPRDRRSLLTKIIFQNESDYPLPDWVIPTFKALFTVKADSDA